MKRKGLFFIATIIALIGINGCDTGPLENAVDDFALVIGLEPINTYPSIMVYDSATDELVSEDVTATFGGEDGDQVIDFFSFPIEQQTFKGGTLIFGLSNTFTPSEDNPASIVVTLNAPGYLESTTELQISAEGLTSFEVDMIPLNALPDNISQTTQTSATDADGNPIPPDGMLPSQEQGKIGVFSKTASTLFFVSVDDTYARNGGLQVFDGEVQIGETFADEFITEKGDRETGYFSSVQKTQIILGTDGKGLSPIPRTGTGGVKLYPGGQIVQTITSQKGEAITSFLGAGKNDLGELWTYLGRHSLLQNSTTYKQFREGNGWILQSSSADYSDMIATETEVVTIDSQESDFTQTQEYLDVITAENDAPKLVIVNLPDENDPYVYLAQNGEVHKYVTFAMELPEKNIEQQFTLNGNTRGSIPVEIQILGTKKSYSIDTQSIIRDISSVYPDIDFVSTTTVKLPWTNAAYNINPSTLNDGATVDITLPQRPDNLTEGTVEVNLICTNGAPGLRLSSLPATPLQFRKQGSGQRWRQTSVEWDYDRQAKVLKGGSFDAQMENNVDYAFQLSIDGTVYPTSGPDVHTISFNNGVATINYPIDNKDFCQK